MSQNAFNTPYLLSIILTLNYKIISLPSHDSGVQISDAVQHLKRVANSYHCPQKTLTLEQWLLLNVCCFSIILPLNICKLNIYKSGNICLSVIHPIRVLTRFEIYMPSHTADKSARDSFKWVTMETTDSFFKTSLSMWGYTQCVVFAVSPHHEILPCMWGYVTVLEIHEYYHLKCIFLSLKTHIF